MYLRVYHVILYTFLSLLMKTELVSSSNKKDETFSETTERLTDNATTQHLNGSGKSDEDQENAFSALSQRFGSSDGGMDKNVALNIIDMLSDKVKCADRSGNKCFDVSQGKIIINKLRTFSNSVVMLI